VKANMYLNIILSKKYTNMEEFKKYSQELIKTINYPLENVDNYIKELLEYYNNDGTSGTDKYSKI
jgi:hypothetical protein